MINVLLTSELPWQRNGVMTLFALVHVSVPGAFLRNRLRELLPPLAAPIMTKFERFVCERFGNILKRSFEGHKNSEINMLSVLLANM